MRAMIRIAVLLIALPLAPAAAQQRIDAPGTVAHTAAGTGFPERVGEFRRASVTRYDDAGRDISASYNLALPEGRLLISVYVYPAARAGAGARAGLCRQEFGQVEQAVIAQHKDASAIEHGPVPAMTGVDPQLTHAAVFRYQTRFGTEVQEVRSEARLYCYVGGDWQVKYRVTSPVAVDAPAAIDAFIRAGPWPGRVPTDETVALPATSSSAP